MAWIDEQPVARAMNDADVLDAIRPVPREA
jgi:hypothetical protein